MSILNNIKSFFYRIALKREMSNNGNISREMLNLSDAKTIGILFDATNSEHSIIISKYADSLARDGKTVQLLGYQDSKSKEPLGEHFFDNNNVNWFRKPIGPKVMAYRNKSFDILVCAFIGESLPLEYLAATSKSRFRVGAFSKTKTDCFELMINLKDNKDLKYLLGQITHFLKVINKNAA